MADYVFDRECRTPHSEAYTIALDGEEVGRVDLHWTAGRCDATLCVPEGFDEQAIQDLIAEIDERLVMSADPWREDFIVTVWAGRYAGTYSEEDLAEEDEEYEDEEEVGGNGRQM